MFSVELSWPAREVWPNYRQSRHWSKFSGARKVQREAARVLTLQAQREWFNANRPKQGTASAIIPVVTVDITDTTGRIPILVTFHPPDRRKRDDDGCIGAFKSARDGIADALGVDDARFQATYIFADPVKGGKVVVQIGGAE